MLLVLLAAGAAQTVDPQMVRTPSPPTCNRELARAAATSPAEARKLGRLPPGVLQLAVDKRVAGCSVTVLPTLDANGDHQMILGHGAPAIRSAAPSGAQGRPQRQR